MARRTKKKASAPVYAVGYVRVSTTGQAEDGVSLSQQEAAIRDHARSKGFKLIEPIYRDAGKSGKRADNRPGLQDALGEVCKCKGVLVCYSLSRLSRSTRDCIDIADQIKACGADLAAVKDEINTKTSNGKFFFTVMAAISQLEREQISDRTKAGLAYKRAQGEKTGGHVPFGYDVRERDGVKVLVKNAKEQRIIKRIVKWREPGEGKKRLSQAKIAAALNAEGIKTKTGSDWTHESVKWIYNKARGKA